MHHSKRRLCNYERRLLVRIFDMTNWDVRITLEAEAIKSTFMDGLMKLFEDTGYVIGQKEQHDNGNKLVWCLHQKKE